MRHSSMMMALLLCALQPAYLSATNPSGSSITITIPALVQISGLNDITLSPTSIGSAVSGNTTACIFTNNITPLGSYYVKASSANASSGIFRATNGTTFVAYSAFWNNSSSPIQTTPLTSGSKSAQQSGGSYTSLTCGGVPNANFNVSFSVAQISAASSATYNDTVTLVVSPS